MSFLGEAPKVEDEDLYETTKQYPIAYDPDNDLDVQVHTAEALQQAEATVIDAGDKNLGDEPENFEEDSDSDDASDTERPDPEAEETAPPLEQDSANSSFKPKRKAKKTLSVIQKVHLYLFSLTSTYSIKKDSRACKAHT